jgi:glycosyltransferase involved in cell wall biosynthesis
MADKSLKILVIAMADSIHTVRWLEQVADMGADIRVFPSQGHGLVHPRLRSFTVYHSIGCRSEHLQRKIKWQNSRLYRVVRSALGIRLLPRLMPKYRLRKLLQVVDDFRPDIIHAMEFQSAGYLTLVAKRARRGSFPVWIMTAWGSDIFYFRNFPEHVENIRGILRECDYLSCECQRDICLSKELGFRGEALPPGSVTGGFDFNHLETLRQPGLVSDRRVIMLKGYQHWVGRALTGLAAIEQCADLLSDYEIIVYASSRPTEAAVRKLRSESGLKVTLLPHGQSHDEILRAHGRARISIGLSMSDGISVSFMEALVMGSFPIQSWTACADEWIEDGVSGSLVPPEDANAVAKALRRALTDDVLVDHAAQLNARTARERLDYDHIRAQVMELYRRVGQRV